MVTRFGYAYAGARMEMKGGVLYTYDELRRLWSDIVTNDPAPLLDAMIDDGLIGSHARRYYLTPEGIAYQ